MEKFIASVEYIQPKFEDLKRRFPSFVSSNYKGLKLKAIDRCKDVSRESREVAFEYVHMDRDASTDKVLAEMDRKGLRPALYEELLGFDEKYPDEQRKYPVVALGSVAELDFHQAACLWGCRERGLSLECIGGGLWYDHYRFLAVRKND